MSEKEKRYKPVPDVEALRYKGTPEKPDIKIFVSHRIDQNSETIDNPLYIPVRCGAVYDERKNVEMLGDDTGDNISEKRMSFCELTVQYWAWKNIEADYYGLCHYRRYLSFASKEHGVDENGQVEEKSLNDGIIAKHNLNNAELISNYTNECDIVIDETFDIRKKQTPKGFAKNVKEHWQFWENVLIEEGTLDLLRDCIEKVHPEFLGSFDKYMDGWEYLGYNCFVMKKKFFNEMCTFQFDTLSLLEKKLNTSKYSERMQRTCGFMGELLYATYVTYLKENELADIKKNQLVFFQYTEKQEHLSPKFAANNIPIVLMSSNLYVAYLCVYLQSLMEASSQSNNYDIIILEKEISEENKKLLKSLAEGRQNISIRFYNPARVIGKSKFYIAHAVYAEEAYYRMLTPWILEKYEKAIVMDCDIIVKRDLADLYNTKIDGYLVAGVKDIVFQGILNGSVPGTYEYVLDEMKMKDPYEYVNTGVLVMNLKEWRKEYTQEAVIDIASSKKFRIQEQDILNVLFEGKMKALEVGWNYYVPVSDFLKSSLEFAPAASYQIYKEAGKNPYLIHYAGVPKPWNEPEVLLANEFWSTARRTPVYELLLGRMMDTKVGQLHPAVYDLQIRAGVFDNRTGIRKVADKLLPYGSRRRKFAKMLLPRDSLRWRFCKQILYIFRPNYRPKKVTETVEDED